MTTAINLSALPAPQIVEVLDYEALLAEYKQTLLENIPEEERAALAATLALESEPITKLLQIAAFRELILRQRVNDAARGVMPAYAQGSDLDHIGARFNVARLVITPADPDAIPPTATVMESDTAFRERIQLSLEGITTAGSTDSYRFHARSAHGDVKDALPLSPEPGEVFVYVLSRSGNGTASPALLAAVEAALNAESVRPLNDFVTVLAAPVHAYAVEAVIHVLPGPDREVIRTRAAAAVQALLDAQHRIGGALRRSALYAALQQPGVDHVELISPEADVVPGVTSAPYCTGYLINMEVAS